MNKTKKHNIGQEILEGIKEIAVWQHGKKKLKVTKIELLDADNPVVQRSRGKTDLSIARRSK